MAMGLMLGEFAERLHGQISIVLPARGLVEKALDEASSVHPSQSIILMEQGCPFMEHLVELEELRGERCLRSFTVMTETGESGASTRNRDPLRYESSCCRSV